MERQLPGDSIRAFAAGQRAPLSPVPTNRLRPEPGQGLVKRPGRSPDEALAEARAARLAQIDADLAAAVNFCSLNPIHIHAQLNHVAQRLGRLVAERIRLTKGETDNPKVAEQRERAVAEEVAELLEKVPQFAGGSALGCECARRIASVERARAENERKSLSVTQWPKYPHDPQRSRDAAGERMKALATEERKLRRRLERLKSGDPVDVVLDIIG